MFFYIIDLILLLLLFLFLFGTGVLLGTWSSWLIWWVWDLGLGLAWLLGCWMIFPVQPRLIQNMAKTMCFSHNILAKMIAYRFLTLPRGALSLISYLIIERVPPLNNSFHTIYFVSMYLYNILTSCTNLQFKLLVYSH